MAVKYCNRALIQSPYYIGLCVREKDFYKEIKKFKIKLPKDHKWLKHTKGARTHEFYSTDGDQLILVCIRKPLKYKQSIICGLLAHEATHIWQFIKEELGETNPSCEFEAYSIGNITAELCEAYKNA